MTNECYYAYKICLLIMQDIKINADISTVVTIHNLISAALCVCLDGKKIVQILII